MKASELELALKYLVETEGVNASAVITKDGIMVASCNKYIPEMVSPFSTVVAMMLKTADACTRMFKQGELKELITKADGGMILTEKCEEFIFLVAADKGIDFESIKPQREKVKTAIKGMV